MSATEVAVQLSGPECEALRERLDHEAWAISGGEHSVAELPEIAARAQRAVHVLAAFERGAVDAQEIPAMRQVLSAYADELRRDIAEDRTNMRRIEAGDEGAYYAGCTRGESLAEAAKYAARGEAFLAGCESLIAKLDET